MKHGPIALIDEDLPVVAVAADDEVFEKSLGNIQEAKARGARMIVVTNASQVKAFEGLLDPSRDVIITVPDAHTAAVTRVAGGAAATARVSRRDLPRC